MLEQLRLRGLGAIAEAELEIGPGFTAITGETGAGKTMLLSGLGLLLGGRGDTGMIAPGADRIEIDGRFRVDPGSPAAVLVEAAGGQLDDGELVLTRILTRDGRSRAVAGGRAVPVSVLAGLAEHLVTVHGQADQRGLLRSPVQRAALDRYGGQPVADALAAYQRSFDDLRALDETLAEVSARATERAREAEALRAGLTEIEAVRPAAGEDEQLAAEAGVLAHLEALRGAGASAQAALAGDEQPSVTALLGEARRALEAVHGRDRRLDDLTSRLAEAGYLIADAASELTGYLHSLPADPGRLEAVNQRLAALRGLARRYGGSAAAAVEWAEAARARLEALAGDEERLAALTRRRAAVVERLAAQAAELTRRRADAATRLAGEVVAELHGLAMTGADLRVECRRRPDRQGLLVDGEPVAFGRHGTDEVEFQLSGHRGGPYRPLHRGASGGELSRVMLAVEVVLAGEEHPPTFIFDEVDAGVGGRAAVEVGRRLAVLARRAQVLVVTHLPQVAAFADQHLVVRKHDGPDGIRTVVAPVAGEQRVVELSRMLSGLPESELALGHAAELLEIASRG